MSETTTIEISMEQKRALDGLKRDSSESYKSVLQLLIESYNGSSELDETRVRQIAQEEINEMVVLEALQ